MKKFILVSGMLVLAACGSGGDSGSAAPGTGPVQADGQCSEGFNDSRNSIVIAAKLWDSSPNQSNYDALIGACNRFQAQFPRGIECRATILSTGAQQTLKSNDVHDACNKAKAFAK